MHTAKKYEMAILYSGVRGILKEEWWPGGLAIIDEWAVSTPHLERSPASYLIGF